MTIRGWLQDQGRYQLILRVVLVLTCLRRKRGVVEVEAKSEVAGVHTGPANAVKRYRTASHLPKSNALAQTLLERSWR